MSDANNPMLVSNEVCSSGDIDESIRQLVPFLCGGMQAGIVARSD